MFTSFWAMRSPQWFASYIWFLLKVTLLGARQSEPWVPCGALIPRWPGSTLSTPWSPAIRSEGQHLSSGKVTWIRLLHLSQLWFCFCLVNAHTILVGYMFSHHLWVPPRWFCHRIHQLQTEQVMPFLQKWDGLSRNGDLLSLRKPVSWILWISTSEKLWKWMWV